MIIILMKNDSNMYIYKFKKLQLQKYFIFCFFQKLRKCLRERQILGTIYRFVSFEEALGKLNLLISFLYFLQT